MEVFTFSATTQPTVIRKKRNIVTETEQHVVINAVVTGAIFAFDIEEAKKANM